MADRLSITPRDHLGIVSVMARKGVDAEAIGAALGANMPSGPHATFSGAWTVVGTGPGTWLILVDDAGPDFAEDIDRKLASLAAVSYQSSSYSVQRLSGVAARTVLQRGAAIDLHPACFRPGSAATTVISHIGVILWQVDEQPSYDIATFRSYARSFHHWLDQTIGALEPSREELVGEGETLR